MTTKDMDAAQENLLLKPFAGTRKLLILWFPGSHWASENADTLLHGVNDEMMPPTESEILKAGAKSKFTLVPLNCGHGDLGQERGRILDKISGFVRELP